MEADPTSLKRKRIKDEPDESPRYLPDHYRCYDGTEEADEKKPENLKDFDSIPGKIEDNSVIGKRRDNSFLGEELEDKLQEDSDFSCKIFVDEIDEMFRKQFLPLSREDDDLDEDHRIDLEFQKEPEDHEYLIRGDAAQLVKIRLFLINDNPTYRNLGFTHTWVRDFVAECTCNGVVVATALARYIRRKRICHRFWERMQRQSEEMRRFAFEVFDHHGILMTKYKNHPVQKGTGVWRSELDQGPLVFFEQLHITAPGLRRKGLGQKVVALLLEKIEKFSRARKQPWEYLEVDGKVLELWTLHALVIPDYLKSEVASDFVYKSPEERLMIKNQAKAVALDFWRSCGFRRIGASECFAFSFSLDHPSHALAAASDFNPRRSYAQDLETQELRAIYEADCSIGTNALRMERLRNALPLHHAALTLTDKELKAFFITHVNDEIGWNRVTNSEATLLHLTACEFKPLSVQWLLDNIHHAKSWKTARDIDGYTPFEALQEILEKMRTQKRSGLWRIESVSDQFGGHPDTAVSCLCLLSGQNSLASQACFRYGCTCGECVEGFISAKMSMALRRQYNIHYTPFLMSIHVYADMRLRGVDPDLSQSLETETSRKGFVDMFELVMHCLEARKAPTSENLEWCVKNILSQERSTSLPSKHIQSYLRISGVQKGCRAVFRLLFEGARRDAEDRLSKDPDLRDKTTCRNDYEFELVARACGY